MRTFEMARLPSTGLLALGSLCNNRCLFCGVAPQDSQILPLSSAIRQIKQLRLYGVTRLVLSGGEPTCHPDLLSIVSIARQLGFKGVCLFTNARAIGKDGLAGKLLVAGLTSVMASLLGPNPRTHNIIAGNKAAFHETLAGIDALRECGVPVLINTVVSGINCRELEQHVEFVSYRYDNQVPLQLSDLHSTMAVSLRKGLHIHYRKLRKAVHEALVMACKLELPYCTSLFPICVLDPFYMDAVELRRHGCEYLIAKEDVPAGVVVKRKGLDSCTIYLHVCKTCSLRFTCSGIPRSYEEKFKDRTSFHPFRFVDPQICISVNEKRDMEARIPAF